MHILAAFLLLVTCDLSISIAIYNRENGVVQNDFQNGFFFDKIRDWFGNLKNQIHERLFEPATTTLPLLSTEILNLDRSSLQKKFRNHEWLLLNLSNISFDPKEDWGFHIGNWYFIRKGFVDQHELENNSNESDVLLNTETTTTTMAFTMHSVRPITMQDTYSSTTSKISEGKTEDSSESSALIKDIDDDGTNNNFVRRGSAEVLMG